MTSTPEFVRWTLAVACPLREGDDWADPERAERQLQSLRRCGEAIGDGRFHQGICVEPSSPATPPARGFRADEVFDAYGGRQYVESLCGECPANAVRAADGSGLAGCFGLFELSAWGGQLEALLESALESAGATAEFDSAFLRTRPRWYGLWLHSPLTPRQRELHVRLADLLVDHDSRFAEPLAEWRTALRSAAATGTPLHVGLYPQGEMRAERWIVSAHCPHCRAARAADDRRRCQVCGSDARATPSRSRHLRGSRPYWPLSGFLNPTALETFLSGYAQQRQQSQQ